MSGMVRRRHFLLVLFTPGMGLMSCLRLLFSTRPVALQALVRW